METTSCPFAFLPKRTRGFTLVEMAIVLVIIGLIVGGVLVGSDLIKSANNRAVISQIDKFNSGILAFRGKYNCLPGDCANPSALGLTADAGDGNGVIRDASVGITQNRITFYSEPNNMWVMLSRAGMIEGDYKTCAEDANVESSISTTGKGFPAVKGKIPGFGLGYLSGVPYFYLGQYRTSHGCVSGTNPNGYEVPTFTPHEALYISTKIGDGKPTGHKTISVTGGRGCLDNSSAGCSGVQYLIQLVLGGAWVTIDGALGSGGAICFDSTVNAYNISNNSAVCNLMVKAQF